MSLHLKRRLPVAVVTAAALAVPGAALAADLYSDAVLGSTAATPTEVPTGSTTFDIKVWASGNVDATKTAQVVNKYSWSSTDNKFVPSTALADRSTISFNQGNYDPSSGSANAVCKNPDPQLQNLGCQARPHVVSATVVVPAGTANGTQGPLTVDLIEGQQLSVKSGSEDTGYVKVATATADTTAPTIVRNSSLDNCSVPGSPGWCRGTQTVGWTTEDAGGLKHREFAGVTTLLSGTSASYTTSSTQNGNAVSIASGSVTDVSDNTNSGINANGWQIDSVAPTSIVTGFTHLQKFDRGSDPTVGCEASDGTSGVSSDGTPTADRSGVTVNGVGPVSVTCNGATDVAGNTQTTASNAKVYTLIHAIQSAIGDPINPDGSSVFSQKRAVPVKFALAGDEADANADGLRDGFSLTGWSVKRSGAVACPGTEFVEEALADTTSSSTGLRYDPAADQYIANATLAGTTAGKCHRFIVELDNGQQIQSPTFKVGK